MAYRSGQQVTVKTAGEYQGKQAKVREEGQDAAGDPVVIVEVHDDRTGLLLLAGFAPDELDTGKTR